MAKEKNALNPAAAHLKAQKKSALKKGKAQLATQRTEKLARRNPDRLQRQIDDLKATETAQGGALRPRDKQQLEQLERDVKAIRKARESNPSAAGPEDRRGGGHSRGGDGASRGRGGANTLGKRRRSEYSPDREDPSEETDEDVRAIPMPLDSPPPIPPRPRRQRQSRNPNEVPLGSNVRFEGGAHPLPAKPVAPAQKVYTSAPQIRNLQKEATTAFVPAAVAARLKQRQAFSGGGGNDGKLLEPEEVDALERNGYLDAQRAADEAAKETAYMTMAEKGADAAGGGSLEEEEAAFERELREVEAEGGEDDVEEARMQREVLAQEARKDARNAAVAMVEETEHILNAEAAGAGVGDAQEEEASRQLRKAEVEDVEDDTWG